MRPKAGRGAAGSGHAIEFADDGMVFPGALGSKKVPWSNYRDASIKRVRTLFSTQNQLIVRRHKGGKVRVSLVLTRFNARPQAVIDVIELMQTKAFALGHRVSPALEADLTGPEPQAQPRPAPNRVSVLNPPRPPAQAEPPSFDADAALANYMAKKARGLVEAPPLEAAPRPAFGRKIA